MDIPWTSLYSEPVVVRVEDVYLLAGPAVGKKILVVCYCLKQLRVRDISYHDEIIMSA